MSHRTNGNHDVLVAAGGYASRYSPRYSGPKSLIPIGTHPILSELLKSIRRQHPSARILVSTNRTDYLYRTQEICNSHGAEVLVDPGFDSTIDLARFAAPEMAQKFCFIYGHTLLGCEGLTPFMTRSESAAVYRSSTRRAPINIGNRFLEPPFQIDRCRVLSSMAKTWSEYIDEVHALTVVDTGLPPEPNTWEEQLAYFQLTLHLNSESDCRNPSVQ